MNYDMKIPVGDESLDATLMVPSEEKDKYPAVIFYHGSGSEKRGYIKRGSELVEKGYVCLAFSFRGCGKSDGDLQNQTINMALEDALAAFDFLTNDPKVDSSRLGVCGRSFGGYLGALVSGKRKIKSLVLSVPSIHPDEEKEMVYIKLDEKGKQYFRKNGRYENTEAIKAIEKYDGELLVIEHEEDTVVPQDVVKAYFDGARNAKSKKYDVIKEAPHHITNQETDEEFIRLITDWFVKTV